MLKATSSAISVLPENGSTLTNLPISPGENDQVGGRANARFAAPSAELQSPHITVVGNRPEPWQWCLTTLVVNPIPCSFAYLARNDLPLISDQRINSSRRRPQEGHFHSFPNFLQRKAQCRPSNLSMSSWLGLRTHLVLGLVMRARCPPASGSSAPVPPHQPWRGAHPQTSARRQCCGAPPG